MIDLKTHVVRSLLFGAAFAATCLPARATDIYSTVLTLTASDPKQFLTVDYTGGTPQSWAGDEELPVFISSDVGFSYKTLTLDIGALEAGFQYGKFLQITVEPSASSSFFSAYRNTYTPTSEATILSTWLGDAGLPGLIGEVYPRIFQVVVNPGDKLVLLMTDIASGFQTPGLDRPARISVEAFADDQFTNLLSAVPEPASWAFMGAGLVALAALRRRPVT